VIIARYAAHKLDGHPELDVDGWNVDRFVAPITGSGH